MSPTRGNENFPEVGLLLFQSQRPVPLSASSGRADFLVWGRSRIGGKLTPVETATSEQRFKNIYWESTPSYYASKEFAHASF